MQLTHMHMKFKPNSVLVRSDSARLDIRVFDTASGSTMSAQEFIASRKNDDEIWREQD